MPRTLAIRATGCPPRATLAAPGDLGRGWQGWVPCSGVGARRLRGLGPAVAEVDGRAMPLLPAACPLPTARLGQATAAPSQQRTRPNPKRAEDPRDREGRRKVVASPRQGIFNYRLKANKTVHHIFHVSADGRDKRKHCALRGKKGLSTPHTPPQCVQM